MYRRSQWQLWILVVAFSGYACSLVGCRSAESDGIPASGSVQVDGQPLSGAIITLEPLGNTPGPSATATVMDGRFAFLPEAGLLGGSYRARFSMIPVDILDKFPPDQAAKLPPRDAVIHPEFDANSNLRCELKRGHENALEFKIRFL